MYSANNGDTRLISDESKTRAASPTNPLFIRRQHASTACESIRACVLAFHLTNYDAIRCAFFNNELYSQTVIMFLRHFIKDRTKPKYNFRQRTHQKELIPKFVNLNDLDFIVCCILYIKNSYWIQLTFTCFTLFHFMLFIIFFRFIILLLIVSDARVNWLLSEYTGWPKKVSHYQFFKKSY